MTALDDALGADSVVWGTHQLKAQWREVALTELTDNPMDSVVDLSGQTNGTMTVTHGLDDALPDPVTMTGHGDAAGVLTAEMIGRLGLDVASTGSRSFVNVQSTGSWDTGAATRTIFVPVGSAVNGDFVISAIVVDQAAATLVQTLTDPKDQWDPLGVIADAPYLMYIYARRRFSTANPYLSLMSDTTLNYVAHTVVLWGQSPSGAPLDFKVLKSDFLAEAVTGTGHTITSVQPGKGYQIAFWGQASSVGIMTTTGVTKYGQPSANGIAVTAGISSLRDAGSYASTGTNGSSTGATVMAAVTVQPFARPVMNAKQWFSQFNSDSPIARFTRDTADVTAAIRTLTFAGGVDTSIFKGQMQGTPINGENVTMTAVSKARIRMNRSIQLPIVSAPREGLTMDWVVTYLMARGGSFVGPAPTKYTRYWAPMYGSTHPHWGTWRDYNAVYKYISTFPLTLFGVRYPTIVPGPFLTAVEAHQNATETTELNIGARQTINMSKTEFPHLYDNGGTGPLMADWMSSTNSKGRFTCWVRGDAVTSAPSYLPSGNDWMFLFTVEARDRYGNWLGYVRLWWLTGTRGPSITMGTSNIGFGSATVSSTFNLPTDGAWHFIGFAWDFAAGQYIVQVDGNKFVGVSSYFATNGWNDTTQLTPTDAQLRSQGGSAYFTCKSHVPMSDVIIDAGNPLTLNTFDDTYPTPVAPGKNAIMRATNIPLNGMAIEGPVNVWDTFSELARNALAMYRANEDDALEFLPPTYFGETAQLTAVAIQDTSTNSADLQADADPSVIRNVITLKFQDTRVDTKPQPVLQYLTVIDIPPGTTLLTLPLDSPAVEIHGAADYNGTAYQIFNLTSTQITTGPLPNSHYISVNTANDGTGTVLNDLQVKATFDSTSAKSVVIRIVNVTKNTVYLANNGQQVPYVNILGYGFRQVDAYTTQRDDTSVLIRTERSLDADFNWLQDRTTAQDIASELVTMLARPRPQVTLTCMADPRRRPGQLVTITDANGTKISGTWRVLTVTHDVKGPSYLQVVTAVQVLPVAVWDGMDGWDNGIWS